MEETFWENFCYYFAWDYYYLTRFCRTYFSLRGLVDRFPTAWCIPNTPRVLVAVPLLTGHGMLKSPESADDSEDDDDGDDEIDVLFEGSLGSSVSSSSGRQQIRIRNSESPMAFSKLVPPATPDIVRTVPSKDRSCAPRRQQHQESPFVLSAASSYQSLLEHDLDRGFCSDASLDTVTTGSNSPHDRERVGAAGRHLHRMNQHQQQVHETVAKDQLVALQQQLWRVQRDMAQLIEWRHSLGNSSMATGGVGAHIVSSEQLHLSSFRPTAMSSPAPSAPSLAQSLPLQHHHLQQQHLPVAPPPPPCGPPPPPVPAGPASVSVRGKAPVNKRLLGNNMPDMSAVLKQLGSVVLRPVACRTGTLGGGFDKNAMPLATRLSLRSVSKNESIIADALRERFKRFRMMPDDDEDDARGDDNGNDTDEWDADDVIARSPSPSHQHQHQEHDVVLTGRSLLRKVDRSQLPAVVTRDLPDQESVSPQ